MLLPRTFADDWFDDFFDFDDFPFFDDKADRKMERKLYGRRARNLMKTDVREKKDSYELDIDLPGFKKEDVELSFENGYLTIAATKSLDKDEKNKAGEYIRKERYAGSMSRSFYIGNNVPQSDIKAKYEDGVLRISIPKQDMKVIENNKTIAID